MIFMAQSTERQRERRRRKRRRRERDLVLDRLNFWLDVFNSLNNISEKVYSVYFADVGLDKERQISHATVEKRPDFDLL